MEEPKYEFSLVVTDKLRDEVVYEGSAYSFDSLAEDQNKIDNAITSYENATDESLED